MFPNDINPIWNYLFYPQPYHSFSNPPIPNYFGSRIPDTHALLSPQPMPPHPSFSCSTGSQANVPPGAFSRGGRRRDEADSFGMKKEKKVFKKDKGCPVEGCGRKYSSRIALRAHIRREHPRWAEQTSDYEP